MSETWKVDVRGGCVAVYRGPDRNCLSGIEQDPDCAFYHQGIFHNGRWTLCPFDVEHAEQVAYWLNQIVP